LKLIVCLTQLTRAILKARPLNAAFRADRLANISAGAAATNKRIERQNALHE
jgi:hypothetical protein